MDTSPVAPIRKRRRPPKITVPPVPQTKNLQVCQKLLLKPRPGPSSRGPAFIQNDSSENLDDAVIINEINRRRNQRYNTEEITFQARIEPEQKPPRLQTTPLVAAVEAVRSLVVVGWLRFNGARAIFG
ncbi:hypothetical protein AVEN_115937-1 [Araneus ventricosus]|uniref:Uncharacterized protein n=1 Tax=Araneus ventricosus TaxID=182803 RepID=A0A4Y2BD51_ARAVE|nr:hypothetical protein AVEN_269303-1 [Araneus ventricosus]GBL90130.1 hypothetical protein AVEN_115937-1 [Araneus ventricosus]